MHPLYTEQQLQAKSLSELKAIYSQIGASVEVADKRCKSAWVDAIVAHQSSQLLHVDEQAIAQAQLEDHLSQQAQAVAAEEVTSVEISFYDHEIYADDKLVAKITHDHDDFITQRWVVMVNDVEVHRADTWGKCYDYITWHFSHGELPVQEPEEAAATTGNEVMVEIATACDEFGFELLSDGIYHNEVKLGEVGCTDGRWWVVLAAINKKQQVPCDCAFDAVWSLSMLEVLPSAAVVDCEELLDKPFEELTADEWELLRAAKPSRESTELIAA